MNKTTSANQRNFNGKSLSAERSVTATRLDWPGKIALLGALFTLLGTLASTFLTAWTSSVAAEQAASQACIKRLDEQEARLREHSLKFLTHMGRFSSLGASKKNGEDEYVKASQDLIQGSFALVAYAPPNLSKATMEMSQAVLETVGPQAYEDKTIMRFIQASRNWPVSYVEATTAFDKERHSCAPKSWLDRLSSF